MSMVVKTHTQDEVDALIKEQLSELMAQVEAYRIEIERQREIIHLLTEKLYGSKSDRVLYNDRQLQIPNLLNEAEALAENTPQVEEAETVPEQRPRKRGGRRKLPKSLEREVVRHDIPDEDKVCPECNGQMQEIGVDTTEKLEYQPARVTVVEHQRPKYGCRCCECAPKQAKPAPQPIPKSIATPSLLAYMLIAKFIDATPLYRQEKQWKRIGVDLGRSLLSSWVVKCGALLEVLWELMQQDLRESSIVQADETPVQVLHEPERSASQKSYMWLFQCGPPGKRIILYHYEPTRAGDVVPRFLGEGFRGYLQSDGYAGYHAFCSRDGVSGVACMAHIRRKFADVTKLHKGKPGLAHEAVSMIRQLYAIEREAKERQLAADARRALRREKAKPIMDRFRKWLDENQSKVPPKLKLGQAFTYARNEWTRMERYLEDGRIEIDNNAAERSIKPFVIGRKNWLFCNTSTGATASAVIYSLLQSASANELPLSPWLTFVLKELPRCTTDEQRRALLPHRFDPSRLAEDEK